MVQWNEHGPRRQELPHCDSGSPAIRFGVQTKSVNPSVLQHPKKASPRHSLMLRIHVLTLGRERTRSWSGREGRKHPSNDCGGVRWL